MAPFHKPSTLFIELTTECNYRCRYCHMWMLRDSMNALSTEERAALIHSFWELNPHGEVVFTGGETMRAKQDFFTLVTLCRTLGLRSAANTNGSYLEPSDFTNVVKNGPTYLVFSLDSHVAAVHDFHRGVKGSFAATTNTIRGLLAAKAKHPTPDATEIVVNSVILDTNVGLLFGFLDFLTDLGVEGVTLQILSPTFHRKGDRDIFYEKHFFADKPVAIQVLQDLIQKLDKYPIVRTTATDLKWMQRYILSKSELDDAICGSHERNLMVDHRGEVQLCFNMRKIFKGEAIGNIRLTSLSDLWTGGKATSARGVMEGCRMTCGMLNCHRRAS